MKKILALLCVAMTVLALQAQDNKLRVAVFDPTSSGTNIDEGTKVAVRELISSTFVNTGKYTIVERSLLDKVMKEQAFSNTGVVDESQATELGRLAGANKVVISVVSLVGGRNMLSIKMIDVKTATVELQKTKVVSSSDLLDWVEPLTLELMGMKATQPASNYSSAPAPKERKTVTPQIITTSGQQQFTVFGDLGLMVTNSGLGTGTWSDAINICEQLNAGGFNDWYLPSKDELVKIFQLSSDDYKNALKSFWFWSSTEIDDKNAYNVAKAGWDSGEKKKNNSPNCLCVRKN